LNATNGMNDGKKQSLFSRLSNGLKNWLGNGPDDRLNNGMTNGANDGLRNGLGNGSDDGLRNGLGNRSDDRLNNGMTNGANDGLNNSMSNRSNGGPVNRMGNGSDVRLNNGMSNGSNVGPVNGMSGGSNNGLNNGIDNGPNNWMNSGTNGTIVQDPYKAGLRHTNPWTFSALIGFMAGLIWGGVKLFFYRFSFTKLKPAFFVAPWYEKDYLNGWQGYAVGLFWIVAVSIAAAWIYAFLFRKLPGPWPGILYGLAWWALVFLWLGPWAGLTESVMALDRDTFWTELCLFVLWGTFIGYSISFEFTDEQSRRSILQVLK